MNSEAQGLVSSGFSLFDQPLEERIQRQDAWCRRIAVDEDAVERRLGGRDAGVEEVALRAASSPCMSRQSTSARRPSGSRPMTAR